MNLKKANALVTGGASGIGLILVKKLLRAGSNVAVFDNNAKRLYLLKKENPSVLNYNVDISNFSKVKNAVNSASSILGGLNILINNAGVMRNSLLLNPLKKNKYHSLKLWRKVIGVNLSGVFNVGSAVAANMYENRSGGVIVNISSISAKGNIGQSAYSASKAGVEALTKVWAKELSPFGIRCVGISPGFSDTEATAEALDAKNLQQWIERVPLRRLAKPDEVVDAILFAIKNDFVNGKIISIDGGLTI